MAAHPPVVVVTGASRGIGLAVTTELLHRFGANVVALSRSRTPELEALRSESLLTIECDVTDEAGFARAMANAVDHFHGVDGLILNAGTLDPLCRIGGDTSISAWKKHFDVNFFSLVTALKLVLPYLRRSPLPGRVVFVSSGAAVKGTAGMGPYNASKAAMNSLCRTLSEEEPELISVAVRPGMVETRMQDVLRETGAAYLSASDHQIFIRAHAEGRIISPEECGHVIAGLSLQSPRSLSGQFLSWDSEECKPFRKK